MTAIDAPALAGADSSCPAGRRRSLAVTAVLFVATICVSPWLLPGWISMFANVSAVFFAFKQCVWLASPNATRGASTRDRLAFYFLWPGLDVAAFLGRGASPPSWKEWRFATGATAAGALGLWIGIPRLAAIVGAPLVIGIAGMLAGVIWIHFGLFGIAALLWRQAGRDVRPIMNAPWAADSLIDFWSRRWNMTFRDSAALLFFRPVARRWGVNAGTFATFLASGLLHEPVISFPAHGGYGLPTVYFLIQYVALAFQRRFIPRRVGGWNWAGRLTTALVLLGPLPLLFHRPFCERVIIPFLRALGAL